MKSDEKERIYREVQHEYNKQEAETQVETYLEETNQDPETILMFDMNKLATMFENNRNNDVPDNVIWQNQIQQYINELCSKVENQSSPRIDIPTEWGTLYAKKSDDKRNPGIYIGLSMINPNTKAECELPAMMMEINTDNGTPTLKAHVWPIDASADEFWDNPKMTLSIPMNKFIENQFSEE